MHLVRVPRWPVEPKLGGRVGNKEALIRDTAWNGTQPSATHRMFGSVFLWSERAILTRARVNSKLSLTVARQISPASGKVLWHNSRVWRIDLMKKLLLSTAAVVVLGSSAFAADLPRYSEPMAPMNSYVYNWTGFYLGLHAGYGFNGDFDAVSDGANGFLGGIQGGYNAQFDAIVFGLEGELSYSGVGDSFNGVSADLNWKGAITPRLGIAFDRFLPYVKAGIAFGDVEFNNALFSESEMMAGWTVGLGVEYAVTNNLSVKVEYDYTDLGRDNFALAAGGQGGYDGHEVKAGVNFRF